MDKLKQVFSRSLRPCRLRLKASVLVSALGLLLLLATFLMFFLEDYRLKRSFNRTLGQYYLAESLKEWSYQRYLADNGQRQFAFAEGTVTITEKPAEEIVRFDVTTANRDYYFEERLQEVPTTESTAATEGETDSGSSSSEISARE